MLVRQLLIFSCALIYTSLLHAQRVNVADSLTTTLSKRYLDKVDKKISDLDERIETKTVKMLQHLQKQEAKVQKKFQKKIV